MNDSTKTRVAADYAITRKQKRYIAKLNMKKQGKKNFCKHSHTVLSALHSSDVIIQQRNPSYFAEHWKEYVEVE